MRKVEYELFGQTFYLPMSPPHKRIRVLVDHDEHVLVVCQQGICGEMKIPHDFAASSKIAEIELRANVALQEHLYSGGVQTVADFKYVCLSTNPDIAQVIERRLEHEGEPLAPPSEAIRRFLELPEGRFHDEPYLIGALLSAFKSYIAGAQRRGGRPEELALDAAIFDE